MKKVENYFVHVICALFCDFFEFTDFWNMTITPKLPINNIAASIEDVKDYIIIRIITKSVYIAKMEKDCF
jgi:hypothetical protein